MANDDIVRDMLHSIDVMDDVDNKACHIAFFFGGGSADLEDDPLCHKRVSVPKGAPVETVRKVINQALDDVALRIQEHNKGRAPCDHEWWALHRRIPGTEMETAQGWCADTELYGKQCSKCHVIEEFSEETLALAKEHSVG